VGKGERTAKSTKTVLSLVQQQGYTPIVYRTSGGKNSKNSRNLELTIPYDKWYVILTNYSSSIALLDDTFKYIIVELQKTGIHVGHYYKILTQNTVSRFLLTDKSVFRGQRVVGVLRLSVMDVGNWHKILSVNTIIFSISKGSLRVQKSFGT
jgi:hypothetical protein